MELVNNIDELTKDNFKEAVMVFKQESFTSEYTEKERSYAFTNNEKYFNADMIGSSLHGKCLDGSDNIRLDMYMDSWKIEKIYVTKR